MFTGLVHHPGTILEIKDTSVGKRFLIGCEFDDLVEGESIAVDGACLTVTQYEAGKFCCDLSPETLKLTRAGYLKVGDRVNLERSLRLSDRLGGHFVSGHVDQTMTVSLKRQLEEYTQLIFSGLNTNARKFLVKKGSVAVNGVSLTLNEVSENSFEVMLIPQTLAKTNLSLLKEGDVVNIEYDFLAKLVVNYLQESWYHETNSICNH